jgi:hypothetical protein
VQKATRARSTVEKPAKRSVVLVVRDPGPGDVRVTGDFTGWSPTGVLLRREPSGDCRTTLLLDPGVYQYRLLVNGVWTDHAQAARRAANPYGGENCVLEVE